MDTNRQLYKCIYKHTYMYKYNNTSFGEKTKSALSPITTIYKYTQTFKHKLTNTQEIHRHTNTHTHTQIHKHTQANTHTYA